MTDFLEKKDVQKQFSVKGSCFKMSKIKVHSLRVLLIYELTTLRKNIKKSLPDKACLVCLNNNLWILS